MKTYIVSFGVSVGLLASAGVWAAPQALSMTGDALPNRSGGIQAIQMPTSLGGGAPAVSVQGAGYSPQSEGFAGGTGGSAAYQSMDSAKTAASNEAYAKAEAQKPATEAGDGKAMETAAKDAKSEAEKKAEKEKEDKEKACKAATEKAAARDSAGAEKDMQKSCDSADYTQTQVAEAKPSSNMAQNSKGNAIAFGADARDTKGYLPPQNLKINGQEISWGKYESFRQIGQSKGFSDQAIQGIAGRLQVESANKAFAVNGTGATVAGDKQNGKYTSFGIEQWHNERADALVDYINDKRADRAEANNTSYNQAAISGQSGQGLKFSTYDQYNYVFDEGKLNPGVVTGGKATYEQLKNSSSALEAAKIWTAKVERPANQAGQAFGLAGGNETVKYTQGFAQAGDNNYVADTSAWGSSKTSNYSGLDGAYATNTVRPGTGTASGGSNPVQQIAQQLLGGGGSVGGIISQVAGGNAAVGNIVNSLMNGGQVSTNDLATAMAQMAVQKMYSSTASGSGSSSSASSGGYSSSGSRQGATQETASAYDALRELAARCGTDLPSSADAIMLMVKSCQG